MEQTAELLGLDSKMERNIADAGQLGGARLAGHHRRGHKMLQMDAPSPAATAVVACNLGGLCWRCSLGSVLELDLGPGQ